MAKVDLNEFQKMVITCEGNVKALNSALTSLSNALTTLRAAITGTAAEALHSQCAAMSTEFQELVHGINKVIKDIQKEESYYSTALNE